MGPVLGCGNVREEKMMRRKKTYRLGAANENVGGASRWRGIAHIVGGGAHAW